MRQLLEEIDSYELAEWMAFDAIEPIGGARGDIQAAIISATIANGNRARGTKPIPVADFIPKYGETEEDKKEAVVEKITNLFTAMSEAKKAQAELKDKDKQNGNSRLANRQPRPR